MQALPFELVSSIFLLGAPDHAKAEGYRNLVTYRNMISSVDSRWREVALSTARLWSVIRLNYLDSNEDLGPHLLFDERIRRIINTLEIALERSQQAPLDLEIRFSFQSVGFHPHQAALIIGALSPHLSHCRRLFISSLWLLPSISVTLPLLESLELELTNRKNGAAHDKPPFTSSPLPRLLHLRLDRYYQQGILPANLLDAIDPSRLTRLALYESRVRDVSAIMGFIAECPHLKHLELWISSGWVMAIWPNNAPSIVLEELEFLGTNLGKIYPFLSTPNLKRLYVTHSDATYLDFLPTVPRLETLMLDVSVVIAEEFPSAFWAVPEIVVDYEFFVIQMLEALLERATLTAASSELQIPSPQLLSLWYPFKNTSPLEDDSLPFVLRVLDTCPHIRVQCHDSPALQQSGALVRYGSRIAVIPSREMKDLTWALDQ